MFRNVLSTGVVALLLLTGCASDASLSTIDAPRGVTKVSLSAQKPIVVDLFRLKPGETLPFDLAEGVTPYVYRDSRDGVTRRVSCDVTDATVVVCADQKTTARVPMQYTVTVGADGRVTRIVEVNTHTGKTTIKEL